jgi:hypothetical protein
MSVITIAGRWESARKRSGKLKMKGSPLLMINSIDMKEL